MKTKRTVISIFTLCTALLFTACSGKGTSNTEASRDTQTEAGSEASSSSNTTLDDLYQQENQLFFSLFPHKQPVGLYVAFPISLEVAGKFVCLIFRRECFALFKDF